MATAGSVVVDLIARTGGFETDMKRAEKRMTELSKTAKKVGAAIGTAFVAGAGAAATALKLTIDTMDDVSKAAQKVGLPTEQLSMLSYAAGLADVSLETLTKSLGKLTQSQADSLLETSEQAKIFDALGISVLDAAGDMRNSVDVLADFADRFAQLKGSPEAMAAGFSLFGRSFQDLVPLVKDGSAAIREAGAELQAFGGVLSTEAGEQAEQFNDDLTRLTTAAKSLGVMVATELLPDLTNLSGEFVNAAKQGDAMRETVDDLADGFRDLVEVGESIGQIFDGLERVREGLVGLQEQAIASGFALKAALTFDGAGLDEAVARYQRATARINAAGAGVKFDPNQGMYQGVDNPSYAALPDYLSDTREFSAIGFSAIGQKPRGIDRDALQDALGNRPAGSAGSASRAPVGKVPGEWDIPQYERWIQLQMEDVEVLRVLDSARRDAGDAVAYQWDGVEGFIEQLKWENSLIGMGNLERETEIALRHAGAAATEEQERQIANLIAERERELETVGRQTEALDALRDSARGFADDLYEGVNAWDALKKAAGDFADQLYQMATDQLIAQILGQKGDSGGGGYGDAIGSIFGAIFGGGKAGGGDVLSGSRYLVGEDGPEMFWPRTAGTIIPAAQTAGMMGGGSGVAQTNHFHYAAPYDAKTEAQVAQRIAFETQRAAQRNR